MLNAHLMLVFVHLSVNFTFLFKHTNYSPALSSFATEFHLNSHLPRFCLKVWVCVSPSLHCSDDTIRFHKSFRHILLHTICVHRVKCQKGIRSVCLDCVNVLDVCSSWHQVIFLIWPLPSSPALISAPEKEKKTYSRLVRKKCNVISYFHYAMVSIWRNEKLHTDLHLI